MEAHTSLALGPSIRSSRSFNSPAALLVKVMARMDQGTAGSRRHSRSCSPFFSGSGRATYSSRKARSSGVTQAGTSLESEPRPYFIRLAMRWMSTVVFPLPAPASSSRGPSVARAAFRCSGFRFPNSSSMAARRALQKRSSSWVFNISFSCLLGNGRAAHRWTAPFFGISIVSKSGGQVNHPQGILFTVMGSLKCYNFIVQKS